MARAVLLELDAAEFDRLTEAMQAYEGDTENRINKVLHDEAGKLISDGIQRLLPVSGRKPWGGTKPKKRAARNTQPFTQDNGNLSVTVRTKYNYHYLYFPDDGSNTKRHVGNLHFMNRGAESKEREIVDRCIASLTEDFS